MSRSGQSRGIQEIQDQQQSLALAGDSRGGTEPCSTALAVPASRAHAPGAPCQALLALGCSIRHLHPGEGTLRPCSATCGVSVPRSRCHS